jgi:hypothetical protein
MAVETIGEAISFGWPVFIRCKYGRAEDAGPKSSRACLYRQELDLETLVCTRGRDFPLSQLESRLRCPRCGNRKIAVLFEPPTRVASA